MYKCIITIVSKRYYWRKSRIMDNKNITDISLSIIGNKWKLLIIKELLTGNKRFSKLKQEVTGISQKVLTLHLRGLEDYGLLTRHVYNEVPPRVEYALTESGRGLSLVIAAIDTWCNEYLSKDVLHTKPSALASFSKSLNTHERIINMSRITTSLAGDVSYNVIETHLRNHDGLDIFGVLYKPETDTKCPVIIISPEFGNTHQEQIEYGKLFASHGIAAYTFDFCGGSSRGSSEGEFKKMSTVTNANDLDAILTQVKNWDFINPEKIILMGLSQGGFATTLTASERYSEIAGVILCYPAYVIVDDVHTIFEKKEDIPSEFDYRGWCIVGGCYAADVWEINPYEKLANIQKPVLYLHGSADPDVPVSYAKKAANISDNIDLHIIDNAPHDFVNVHFGEAAGLILNHLRKLDIINS